MKKYALIGFPLTHSFSQKYFEQKFAEEQLTDCSFINYSIEKIEMIENIITDKELLGFCITIPHKKNIISYLHRYTKAVEAMQACNCVKIYDGKLYGFNTDVEGFKQSFIPHLLPHHTKALLLGTGGAASAVAYVLEELKIPFTYVSRTKKDNNFTYEEINKDTLEEYTVIINASPVGTYPNVDEAPALPYAYLTNKHYLFDLVYNPAITKFLQHGIDKGSATQNGYPMLTIQAEENWKIWNAQGNPLEMT